MTGNVATLQGYTQEMFASSGEGLELHLLITPDTDLNDHFEAWDCDAQEFILVTGWMFSFDPVDA